MHDTNRRALCSRQRSQLRIKGETGDVIHQSRACRQSSRRHWGLAGINADRHVNLWRNRCNHWCCAFNLGLNLDIPRSRPCGFPPNINDRRTLINHRLCPVDRLIQPIELPTIRKTVWRHIQNAHDLRRCHRQTCHIRTRAYQMRQCFLRKVSNTRNPGCLAACQAFNMGKPAPTTSKRQCLWRTRGVSLGYGTIVGFHVNGMGDHALLGKSSKLGLTECYELRRNCVWLRQGFADHNQFLRAPLLCKPKRQSLWRQWRLVRCVHHQL